MWLWRYNYKQVAAAAKSLQLCPTLCDPIDGSPPGSPVPGILQSRTLEWVAISFSNAWKWKVKVKMLSCVRLLVTPWTAAHQAPPSMGFSRQEYWSRLPYALIYNICSSLSDFLHSVWQTLGPSTSQQITQFCSFLCLRNIVLKLPEPRRLPLFADLSVCGLGNPFKSTPCPTLTAH